MKTSQWVLAIVLLTTSTHAWAEGTEPPAATKNRSPSKPKKNWTLPAAVGLGMALTVGGMGAPMLDTLMTQDAASANAKARAIHVYLWESGPPNGMLGSNSQAYEDARLRAVARRHKNRADRIEAQNTPAYRATAAGSIGLLVSGIFGGIAWRSANPRAPSPEKPRKAWRRSRPMRRR
jgi:ABC-type transport system involved in cytochrome c biogenesis permease subunit